MRGKNLLLFLCFNCVSFNCCFFLSPVSGFVHFSLFFCLRFLYFGVWSFEFFVSSRHFCLSLCALFVVYSTSFWFVCTTIQWTFSSCYIVVLLGVYLVLFPFIASFCFSLSIHLFMFLWYYLSSLVSSIRLCF